MKSATCLVMLISLILGGCDFTVPLSDKPGMAIDRRAIGLWERTKSNGNVERLLVLPLDKKEYFISWPEGANTELYARAHLFEFSGKTLVQLYWFGNSDAGLPDDGVAYQVATFTLEKNELEIRLLNADLIGKEFASTHELAAAIKIHIDHRSLFREKMTFYKTSDPS